MNTNGTWKQLKALTLTSRELTTATCSIVNYYSLTLIISLMGFAVFGNR